MKEFLGYIQAFYKGINKPFLYSVTLFMALMIYLNEHYKINQAIEQMTTVTERFYSRYLLLLAAFAIPYAFCLWQGKNYFKNTRMSFIILLAPAIYALKMALPVCFHFSEKAGWNAYWNQVTGWPMQLAVLSVFLFLLCRIVLPNESLTGIPPKNFNWKPYLLLLILMIPLVITACLQQEFLHVYPRLNHYQEILSHISYSWLYKLLFELSYGTDFISVELFFRGFLILALVNLAGKDAILPMACFYCCIHFGKPLGECISSYFGGMFLGIVVFYTRTLSGAVMIHLGLAWFMEVGASLAHAANRIFF